MQIKEKRGLNALEIPSSLPGTVLALYLTYHLSIENENHFDIQYTEMFYP